METSLHRQLKQAYAGDGGQIEAPLEGYRIDVLHGDRIVEIQHGSLAAIRDKVGHLLPQYPLLLVKPIVARKQLVKLDRKNGRVVSRRASPKRNNILALFDELVYFTRVFPHHNLTLEVPLVEVEEWRIRAMAVAAGGVRGDFQIADQKLLAIGRTYRFRTARDLGRLIPAGLPRPFDTRQLAHHLDVDRWVAQRIAYCLRETGATTQQGKRGNAWLYAFAATTASRQAMRRKTTRTGRRRRTNQPPEPRAA